MLLILKGDIGISDSWIGNMRSIMAMAEASGRFLSGPVVDAYGPRVISCPRMTGINPDFKPFITHLSFEITSGRSFFYFNPFYAFLNLSCDHDLFSFDENARE